MARWQEQLRDMAQSGAQTIHMNHQKLGDPGAREVAEVLRTNGTVQRLFLGGNQIGESGVREVARALCDNSALEELSLFNNRIGDAGVCELAAALRNNTTLAVLDLAQNDIGAAGEKELSTLLLNNATLRTVYLNNNAIAHAEVHELADVLRSNTSLELLDLSGNSITDNGARELADALRINYTLETLLLDSNDIRPELLEEIDFLLSDEQREERAHTAAEEEAARKAAEEEALADMHAALAPIVEAQNGLIAELPALTALIDAMAPRGKLVCDAAAATHAVGDGLESMRARRELLCTRTAAVEEVNASQGVYAELCAHVLAAHEGGATVAQLDAHRRTLAAKIDEAATACDPEHMIVPPVHESGSSEPPIDAAAAVEAFNQAIAPHVRELRCQSERVAAAQTQYHNELAGFDKLLQRVSGPAQTVLHALCRPIEGMATDRIEQARLFAGECAAAEACAAHLRAQLQRVQEDIAQARAAHQLKIRLSELTESTKSASKLCWHAELELKEHTLERTATDAHRSKVADLRARLTEAQEAEQRAMTELHKLADDCHVPEAAAALRFIGAAPPASGTADAEWDALVRRGVAFDHRSLDDFERISHLASQGGQSSTMRAFHKASKRWCVLKSVARGRAKQLYNEVRILARQRHANIVALECVFRDQAHFYVQMPLVQGGNLREWMTQEHTAEEKRGVFRGIVAGVLHLHNARIVHRDLKPENVLITAEGVPKLCDFGISRTDQLLAATVTDAGAGTAPYKAPEQLRGEAFSSATDMYALGLLLHELVLGEPYPVTIAARAHAHTVQLPRVPEGGSGEHAHAIALLHQLLQFRPEDRPAAFEVSVHPFLRSSATATADAHGHGGEDAIARVVHALLPMVDGRVERAIFSAPLHIDCLLSGMCLALAEIDANIPADEASVHVMRTEMEVGGAVVPREDVYALVLRHVCREEALLFTSENGASFLPLPTATSEEQLWSHFALGRMLGQALIDGVRVRDVPFPDVMLQFALCGEQSVVSLPVQPLILLLRDYDAPLADQYTQLLAMDVTGAMLPGVDVRGADVDMNNGNKFELVRRACIDKLVSSRAAQLHKFREGLRSVPAVDVALQHVREAGDLRVLLASAVADAGDRARVEEERARQAAQRAMVRDLGHGRAFECPNGHIFFIGECGGAMEEGTCIECGARVGGRQHRLRGDNRHRGDVDGSEQPAWPQ